MCAILDASVVSEVFSRNRPEAGEEFYKWISKGKGRLVAGGELLSELRKVNLFREWEQEARRAGRLRVVNENEVSAKTRELEKSAVCRSNDPHVLALAQVSGARLLYSIDADLQTDFGCKNLIDKPRGKVYSTLKSKSFQSVHGQLLKNRNLCRSPK